MILEGSKLKCDSLQFGFQPESGTVMCTWMASAVIDFFNKKGTVVYGAAMDLSKAFDMVDWRELFSSVMSSGILQVSYKEWHETGCCKLLSLVFSLHQRLVWHLERVRPWLSDRWPLCRLSRQR